MRNFLDTRRNSFRYAFQGWWFVLRTQRNAWIHGVVSIAVVLLSTWLRIEARDWAVIIIAITMVWMAEFANTALEAVVDLASQHQQQELARVSKDVGAATVLIAALSSVIIGVLVLGPPFWARLFSE